VITVYVSHIHSYFDYTKDGVRYITAEVRGGTAHSEQLLPLPDCKSRFRHLNDGSMPSPANLLCSDTVRQLPFLHRHVSGKPSGSGLIHFRIRIARSSSAFAAVSEM
jgi:hypothetical protein